MRLNAFLNGTFVLALGAATALGQAAATAPATNTPAPPKNPPWEASAGFGVTLTRGNSKTLLLNFDFQAGKKWDELRNELRLGANATYGENDGVKNSEQIRGFVQYNRLFTERLFGYLRVEGLHDAIADVDYRLTFSPGAGYYFIKNANTSLSGEVGPGYIYEKQGGITHDYITLRLAERFDHKINDRAKIWEAVEVLPQVDRFENYIINGEIGIDTTITKHLSQRTFLQDTYHSKPAPGRLKNDLKLVAAIVYKF